MVKLTIDDIDLEVPEGTSVIAAADRAGVFIPRFCYHPDLRPVGNCRICQVEVEGNPRLVVSCMTPVKDGMVVHTDTPRVKQAVRGDLEFLLLNHPVDCPICDQAGECYLQDFYMRVGLHHSRMPLADKVRKRKVVDLGARIVLDSERCVLCSRCIRFSDEVSQTHQLGFFRRGSRMEIGTFRDRPLQDAYAGCYADVCPVGALTSRDFRFQSRVWFLQRTPSICPHCSTGCNIHIDHKSGRVYRFVPRRNAAVNASWMCDVGRLASAELNPPDRLLSPRLRRDGALVEASWDEALGQVGERLRAVSGGRGTAVGIATPRATCEELWSFERLIRRTLGSPHLDYRVDPSWQRLTEREDALLRRADHHPNSRGAELLGIIPEEGGWDVRQSLDRAARGEVGVLFLLGPELFGSVEPERVEAALKGAGSVVLMDTRERPEQAWVDLLLPVATFAEVEGTFLNHAGRLQRLTRAWPPPGGTRAAVEVLGDLRSQLSGEETPRSAAEVFAEMAESVAALDGRSFQGVGPLGVALEIAEVDTALGSKA